MTQIYSAKSVNVNKHFWQLLDGRNINFMYVKSTELFAFSFQTDPDKNVFELLEVIIIK